MSDDTAASYDRVVYPGSPTTESHPDRLATIATLFGMRPAPASRCRVLELGCGVGGNLASLAYLCPESEFVGIDISPHSIAIGQGNIKALGLSNIALHHLDLMEVAAQFGRFDYIIAHGVYSWVPPIVRDRLLSIYKSLLAPQGVGYVSYNALPGGHLRHVARDMMLFHVRDMEEPAERIAQSHALLRFIAGTVPEDDTHGAILREQFKRIEDTKPEVFYHDDLLPSATPFLLHHVAEAAARHSLQYLGDARFGRTQALGLPAAVAELIDKIPRSEAVEREQYADFVIGRAFRATLLCHDDVVLDRDVEPARVANFLVAANLAPRSDPLALGPVRFAGESGATLETDHPLGKAALAELHRAWPRPLGFHKLAQASAQHLRRPGAKGENEHDIAVDALADLLFRAYCAGHVELHSEAPRLTTEVSARPRASLLARRLAEEGPAMSNLRHTGILLRDEITRRFLILLDGTRTIDDLVEAINSLLAAGRDEAAGRPLPPSQVTRPQVEENLRVLARLALLEA